MIAVAVDQATHFSGEPEARHRPLENEALHYLRGWPHAEARSPQFRQEELRWSLTTIWVDWLAAVTIARLNSTGDLAP
jgi:hypothetical protein